MQQKWDENPTPWSDSQKKRPAWRDAMRGVEEKNFDFAYAGRL
ncbi:MAG: hypothetical protein HW419_59 [Deltaproteobacteria bacterium]|nr:hypothetical protein [Deltaproteobacteria bacterium]